MTATGAALLAEHHPQWIDGRAGGGHVRRYQGDVADLLALGDWLVLHPH
jgi:hypothetical protein